MKTIWKYKIKKLGITRLEVPADAVTRFCDIDMNGDACIWFEVDTDRPLTTYFILAKGTGMSIDPELSLDYIGTINDDGYMYHIYKIIEEEV